MIDEETLKEWEELSNKAYASFVSFDEVHDMAVAMEGLIAEVRRLQKENKDMRIDDQIQEYSRKYFYTWDHDKLIDELFRIHKLNLAMTKEIRRLRKHLEDSSESIKNPWQEGYEAGIEYGRNMIEKEFRKADKDNPMQWWWHELDN